MTGNKGRQTVCILKFTFRTGNSFLLPICFLNLVFHKVNVVSLTMCNIVPITLVRHTLKAPHVHTNRKMCVLTLRYGMLSAILFSDFRMNP